MEYILIASSSLWSVSLSYVKKGKGLYRWDLWISIALALWSRSGLHQPLALEELTPVFLETRFQDVSIDVKIASLIARNVLIFVSIVHALHSVARNDLEFSWSSGTVPCFKSLETFAFCTFQIWSLCWVLRFSPCTATLESRARFISRAPWRAESGVTCTVDPVPKLAVLFWRSRWRGRTSGRSPWSSQLSPIYW